MAASKKNRPLEPWQKDDARRLDELFKKSGKKQLTFGLEHGIGTQGLVSQFLKGRTALHLEAAVKFARGLGCSVADFSPKLAQQQAGLAADAPPIILGDQQHADFARDGKEEQVLELWRKLQPHQRNEILKDMLVFVVANDAITPHVARGVIRTVEDSRIEDKFGRPPAKTRKRRGGKGKPQARRPDRAQDDIEGAP